MIRWMRNPTGPCGSRNGTRRPIKHTIKRMATHKILMMRRITKDCSGHLAPIRTPTIGGPKCDEGDSGKVDGWSYDVLASGPGVVHIVIPRSGVTGRN